MTSGSAGSTPTGGSARPATNPGLRNLMARCRAIFNDRSPFPRAPRRSCWSATGRPWPAPGGPIDLIDGHSDPPLSGDGHRQALAVGERVSRFEIGALYVTPLRRTQQTAEPLAQRLGSEPIVIPELREVFLGEWEGQLGHRVAHDVELSQRLFAAERWDVIPGAEPMEQFSERIRAGLERIVRRCGPNAARRRSCTAV